jgi:hypothetical protein
MRSRVGTHRPGEKYPRDTLFKGRNIQELSVRDTSVGDINPASKVERQVNVLIKNLAIFFLFYVPASSFCRLISWLPLKFRSLKMLGPLSNFKKSNNCQVHNLQTLHIQRCGYSLIFFIIFLKTNFYYGQDYQIVS